MNPKTSSQVQSPPKGENNDYRLLRLDLNGISQALGDTIDSLQDSQIHYIHSYIIELRGIKEKISGISNKLKKLENEGKNHGS